MRYNLSNAKMHQTVAALYYQLKTESTDLSWTVFYQNFATRHYKEARRLMGMEGGE